MKNEWLTISSGVQLKARFAFDRPFSERKSGTPLSVETPAPPKSTILLLSSIIFLSSSYIFSMTPFSRLIARRARAVRSLFICLLLRLFIHLLCSLSARIGYRSNLWSSSGASSFRSPIFTNASLATIAIILWPDGFGMDALVKEIPAVTGSESVFHAGVGQSMSGRLFAFANVMSHCLSSARFSFTWS